MLVIALACTALGNSLHSQESNPGQRASTLSQQGNITEAEAAWRKVLESHPADAEANANLGLLEARQEHYREAIAFYRKALAAKPQMPGLRLNLGLAQFKAGQFKPAIQTFVPLLNAQPKSSPEAQRLSTLIGLAHYGLGEYALAIPYLKKATAADPQNLAFRMTLARSCLVARQFQCVLDEYHDILSMNAESAEADMLAGEALDEMQDRGAAIEQFRAAVKSDPRFPDAHFGLGYLLWTQNKFEEAAKEFAAELENVPDHTQALAFLADSDMQIGKSEEALPLIEKALRLDPNFARAHLDLGILHADAGRTQQALTEFQTAARLTPEDPNVHWRMARLYQSMGLKDKAKVEFDKTSNLHKAENATILTKLKAAREKEPPLRATPAPVPANP